MEHSILQIIKIASYFGCKTHLSNSNDAIKFIVETPTPINFTWVNGFWACSIQGATTVYSSVYVATPKIAFKELYRVLVDWSQEEDSCDECLIFMGMIDPIQLYI